MTSFLYAGRLQAVPAPRQRTSLATVLVLAAGLVLLPLGLRSAGAATPVGLGTATSFAVLAGSTVTNTGPTVINGNLGVSPGTAITGFPPGLVNGAVHAANPTALQAKADLTTAYNAAASQATDVTVTANLGGQTLVPGVYTGSSLALTGTLTLDAGGNPSAVFVFQSGSTFLTASSSRILLVNGASACNVFFQVGSSATFGTNSNLVGTFLVQESITATTGSTVSGRLLARSSAVTLDSNLVNIPNCATPPAPAPTPTGTPSSSPTLTASPTATPSTPVTASPAPPATAPSGPRQAGSGGQVARVPTGGVQAGGGSTAGLQHAGLLSTGIGLLLAAGLSGWLRRRTPAGTHRAR